MMAERKSLVTRLCALLAGSFSTGLAARSLAGLTIKVVAIPLGLGISALLTRVLSVEQFGIFGVATSIFVLFATPVARALSSLSLRETSASYARGDLASVKGHAVIVATFILLCCIAYWTILAITPRIVTRGLFWDSFATLRWTVVLYPAFIITLVGGSITRSLDHVIAGILPEQLFRPLFFFLALALVYLVGATHPKTAEWAFGIQTIAVVASAVVAVILVLRAVPRATWRITPSVPWGIWLKSGGPFLILGLAQVANSQLPMILLGILSDATNAAHYKVSDQLASLASLGLLAVNLAFAPMISRLSATEKWGDLQSALRQASYLIYALTFPAVGFLLLFPDWILQTLFGPKYVDATVILIVLCLRTGFNAVLGPVGLVLNMLGHEKETLRGVQISLFANLVFSIGLIPVFGGLGAAMASLLGTVIINLMLLFRLHKLEGLSTMPWILRPTSRRQ